MKLIFDVTTTSGKSFEVSSADLPSAALHAESMVSRFNPIIGVVLNVEKTKAALQKTMLANQEKITPNLEVQAKFNIWKIWENSTQTVGPGTGPENPHDLISVELRCYDALRTLKQTRTGRRQSLLKWWSKKQNLINQFTCMQQSKITYAKLSTDQAADLYRTFGPVFMNDWLSKNLVDCDLLGSLSMEVFRKIGFFDPAQKEKIIKYLLPSIWPPEEPTCSMCSQCINKEQASEEVVSEIKVTTLSGTEIALLKLLQKHITLHLFLKANRFAERYNAFEALIEEFDKFLQGDDLCKKYVALECNDATERYSNLLELEILC